VVGADTVDGRPVADVGPDQSRELRAIVSVRGQIQDSTPIRFSITDRADGNTVAETDNFRGPGAAK
jgi:hypothetical protein